MHHLKSFEFFLSDFLYRMCNSVLLIDWSLKLLSSVKMLKSLFEEEQNDQN